MAYFLYEKRTLLLVTWKHLLDLVDEVLAQIAWLERDDSVNISDAVKHN